MAVEDKLASVRDKVAHDVEKKREEVMENIEEKVQPYIDRLSQLKNKLY